MGASLAGYFQIRRGEARRVLGVALVAVLYTAAITLGDDISQALFVSRIGAAALPRVFLFKAVIDLAAAALYAPLARRRSPVAVLRIGFASYGAAVLLGLTLVDRGGGLAPYALYVLHECASTVLTIHWGVYLLEVFDASQARRLFPLLFTASRVGAIAAGTLLGGLAARLGAANLLGFAAGFAALAAVASRVSARREPHANAPLGADASEGQLAVDEDEVQGGKAPWRRALASPLLRAIAWSTASMVIVRYGLRMLSTDQLNQAFRGDENLMAEFLGGFSAGGNVVTAVVGLLLMPRLLLRLGAGLVNTAYAAASLAAMGCLVASPSLAVAALARFVEGPIKDAVKTPLSALFYGGERPSRRGPARALVFGAIIPAATAATALGFGVAAEVDPSLAVLGWIGLAAALGFVACSVWQGRAFRQGLADLLSWKLERAERQGELGSPAAIAHAQAELAGLGAGSDLASIARGLTARDPRLRAVAEEVLAEHAPRHAAHRAAQRVRLAGDGT